MFVNSDSDLRFEVTFRGKDEFGVKYGEIDGKAWILADSDKDIVLDVNCFQIKEIPQQPDLLLELYVDGVLRNILKPRTGRGLAENQIAEAMIDRGVVLSEDGMPLLKKFRFVDLDIDDAVLTSRLVEEAGAIEVRIVQAGLSFNQPDDIDFDLPTVLNDRGAVSLFCGELNNTVGVRFDDGDESVRDTREIRLQTSIDLMLARQNEILGETLAVFTFNYASDAILLHLGVIPPEHKKFNQEMASERLEVRTRYDPKLSKILLDRAVSNSDYSVIAMTGELNISTNALPKIEVPANSPRAILSIRGPSAVTPDRATKRKGNSPCATPRKNMSTFQAPLTPPITPQVERTVVYDMTQWEDDVVEVICID